jgi:hypothetical protein
MTTHPVQLVIHPAQKLQRLHLVIRLALLIALGAVGISSVYWILYLALPAVGALLISQKGGERYLDDDAPGYVRALRWLAGAYAYLWLLTDAFPTGEHGTVELAVEPGGTPTVKSALLRLIYSLPALLVLAVLSFAGSFLWIIAALVVLVRGRTPGPIADFFALTLRFQFRLIAYHLSLVDRYPSGEAFTTPEQRSAS